MKYKIKTSSVRCSIQKLVILKLLFYANCCGDNLYLAKIMPFGKKSQTTEYWKTKLVLLFFTSNVYQKLTRGNHFHLIFALEEKLEQFKFNV